MINYIKLKGSLAKIPPRFNSYLHLTNLQVIIKTVQIENKLTTYICYICHHKHLPITKKLD